MCTAMARNKSTDPREHTGTRARRGEYPRRCAAPGLQVERLLDPSREPTMTAFGPDDPAQGGVGAPGAGDLLHREPTKIKVEGINLTYSGLIPQIQKSFLSKDVEAMQPHVRAFVERAVTFATCPECDGTRLSEETRSSKIDGVSIADVSAMQITDLADWVAGLDEPSVAPLLETLRRTLDSFVEIGLGYLSLGRPSGTLSGGEA